MQAVALSTRPSGAQRPCRASSGFFAASPVRSGGPRRTRRGLQASARSLARAQAVSNAQAALQRLFDSSTDLEATKIAQLAAEIEAASAEASTDKIVPELNQGIFEAKPLTGRLKNVNAAAAPLLLGGLTFASVQPADLKISFHPPAPFNFRGQRGGRDVYSVTTTFSVEGQEGLAGSAEVGGPFSLDPDNPQRLHITFADVTVRPEVHGKAALQRWVQLFAAANAQGPARLDAATGVVTAALHKPVPAWLDFVLMTEEWQLARTNYGSLVLLRRRED